MSQNRTFDFRAQADTNIINRHLKDGVAAGAHRGLLAQLGAAGKLTITAGVLYTAEGIRVEETADLVDTLDIPTEPTVGLYRADRIVLRHQYQTAWPPIAARYEVIEGTPAATPTVPDEPTDAVTLALGFAGYNPGEYELMSTGRWGENFKTIILGDGVNYLGEYNGAAGLQEIVNLYRDIGADILAIGDIAPREGSFVLPSRFRLRGMGSATQLHGVAGEAVVAFEGYTSATGLTAAPDFIDNPAGGFNQVSLGAKIIVSTGPDAGRYTIVERVSDTRLRLETSGGTFTGGGGGDAGGGCLYTAQAVGVMLQDCELYPAANGLGVYLARTEYADLLRLRIFGRAADITGIIADTQCNRPLIEHCRGVGTFAEAINLDYATGGMVLDNAFDSGDITLQAHCSDMLCDRNVADDVVLLGANCGAIGKPFSEEHGPDGTHPAYARLRGAEQGLLMLSADDLAKFETVDYAPLGNDKLGTNSSLGFLCNSFMVPTGSTVGVDGGLVIRCRGDVNIHGTLRARHIDDVGANVPSTAISALAQAGEEGIPADGGGGGGAGAGTDGGAGGNSADDGFSHHTAGGAGGVIVYPFGLMFKMIFPALPAIARCGGSCGAASGSAVGGPAGGTIVIIAGGTVTINGTVDCGGGYGIAGSVDNNGGGGGGGGGAILIIAQQVVITSDYPGVGILSAAGGNGAYGATGTYGAGGGGGGGGGIVAIGSVEEPEIDGMIDVSGGGGGAGGLGIDIGSPGSAGTNGYDLTTDAIPSAYFRALGFQLLRGL